MARRSSPDPAEQVAKNYYETLYQERLGWSGHFIPVRIERKGFYLEAYLIAPPSPGPGKYVPVKLAILPTKANDTIHVQVSKILPSARQLYKSDREDSKVASTKVAPVTKEHLPPQKKITTTSLRKLEHYFPGTKWTLFELLALFGKPAHMGPIMLAKCKDLSESGTKYCLITGQKQRAYRIGKVVTVATTPDIITKDTIPSLEKEYQACMDCELGTLRHERGANLVFGRGAHNAKGMIIAESPWEMEERDKKPLHPDAPAGGVLYRVMKKVGLSQNDWYLTNSVICRPLLDPKGELAKNKPKTDHLRACSTRLKRTLHTVSPRIVVLLGTHAYQAWFGYPPEGGVGRNLGWVSTTEKDTKKVINYYVFFTYHPSYIARQEGLQNIKSHEAKKLYLEQWLMIAEAFKEVTSE